MGRRTQKCMVVQGSLSVTGSRFKSERIAKRKVAGSIPARSTPGPLAQQVEQPPPVHPGGRARAATGMKRGDRPGSVRIRLECTARGAYR